ncbi:MAG: hypothetical protein CM15mV77_010 [uncultured marine virus]|nr:MAG: hypothetical protein CM15mV77_010 [uncultured marine virus]
MDNLQEILHHNLAEAQHIEIFKPKKEEFETEVTESGDIKFKLDKDGKNSYRYNRSFLKETIEKKKLKILQ